MAIIKFTLLAGIFTSVLSVVRAGDWCWTTTIEYCDYGCCDNKCCSAEVGIIVGAVIGGLCLLALIIGLIVLCCYLSYQKKQRGVHCQGQVLQPNTGTTTNVTPGAYPAPAPQPGAVYYQNTAVAPQPPAYGYGYGQPAPQPAATY